MMLCRRGRRGIMGDEVAEFRDIPPPTGDIERCCKADHFWFDYTLGVKTAGNVCAHGYRAVTKLPF